jgi:biopolymer transport protein ExbB/TolQ
LTTTAVSILTATVSGLFVAIPSIITTVMTANAREKVQEERMKQMGEKIDRLSEKVEHHNHFESRILLLEQKVDMLKGVS